MGVKEIILNIFIKLILIILAPGFFVANIFANKFNFTYEYNSYIGIAALTIICFWGLIVIFAYYGISYDYNIT